MYCSQLANIFIRNPLLWVFDFDERLKFQILDIYYISILRFNGKSHSLYYDSPLISDTTEDVLLQIFVILVMHVSSKNCIM